MRTLQAEREAIVEKLANFIHRSNTSMYKSQEAREIDIKNSIKQALLSHEEKVVARERAYALSIINKYEKMPFAPTTFARIKASITLPITDKV